MAIRKKSGKKPTVRKPAKPSVRKPAKASVRKPARPAARKTVARKAPVRKASARPASAGVRRTTLPTSRPAAPRPLTPAPTTPTSTPQGDGMGGIGGSHGSPQQPSFYHQAEQPMATHTVKEGETLSHIALRYYGNASEKYYMHIYNANRGVIGDNPNLIKVGQDLTIPKPPAD
jgi:nucleoid-associated protein YgaU